jgi:site-specific recombinase XerD
MNEYKINFYIDKAKYQKSSVSSADKSASEKVYSRLMISVAWNNERVRTTININIEERLWNANKQRVKASAMNSRKINDKLDKFRVQLNGFYDMILKEKKRPPLKDETKNAIRAILNDKDIKNLNLPKKKREKSFLGYFKEFIRNTNNGDRLSEKGTRIGNSTISTYHTTLNHLKSFAEQAKFHLSFDNINDSFFSSFSKYLSKNNINNNSQGKYIKVIKSMMHYYYDQDVHQNHKFIKDLKVRNEDSDQVALNKQEIKKISELTDLSEKQEKTRDLFLIQIHTGLRYSDLANLKPENINYDSNTISLKMIKTKTSIRIPIPNEVALIFKKYNGTLPAISNQKYNKNVKELCKIAEFTEPIQRVNYVGGKRIEETQPKYEFVTSHTGRRTFITESLLRGVLPEEIMKITGHKSMKSFQKYIKITDNGAINSMRKAWEE